MKNLPIIIGMFFVFYSSMLNAQVAINQTGIVAASSAMLDIAATNKGILIPRVLLDSTTDVITIASPDTSLLVYNANTANDVSPGFFYYSGSKWNKLVGATEQNAYNLVYGGNITSGKSLTYNGSAASGGANNGTPETIGFVPKDGDAKRLSWYSTNADATTQLDIVVDGVSNIVTLDGAKGVMLTNIVLIEENEVEIKHVSGTQTPGKISLTLFVE